jgi:Spy/CpxP family protein refolding chaperone
MSIRKNADKDKHQAGLSLFKPRASRINDKWFRASLYEKKSFLLREGTMNIRVAFLALLFAALPFSAIAQTNPGTPAQADTKMQSPIFHPFPLMGMGSKMQIDRSLKVLQRNLNLSNSQVSRVRQLAESRKTRFESVRDQAQPKLEELMALLRQPNPDPAAVGRATIALKQVHDQAVKQQADLEKDFLNILTDSQRRTVNSMISQAPSVLALHRLGLLAPDGMRHEQAADSGE